MEISKLLQINKGITAIIGGGGKTTLMLTLARELSQKGRVIMTTSTRILKPADVRTITAADEEIIRQALVTDRVVCVAQEGEIIEGACKLAPPALSFDRLCALCDYLIVEADGSKGLPLKAHEAHEPVIPEGSDVICVVGCDGFYRPIEAVCHRPVQYARLAGATNLTDRVIPRWEAAVLHTEALHHKVYINKVENQKDWLTAKELAGYLTCPVVAGSLLREEYRCL